MSPTLWHFSTLAGGLLLSSSAAFALPNQHDAAHDLAAAHKAAHKPHTTWTTQPHTATALSSKTLKSRPTFAKSRGSSKTMASTTASASSISAVSSSSTISSSSTVSSPVATSTAANYYVAAYDTGTEADGARLELGDQAYSPVGFNLGGNENPQLFQYDPSTGYLTDSLSDETLSIDITGTGPLSVYAFSDISDGFSPLSCSVDATTSKLSCSYDYEGENYSTLVLSNPEGGYAYLGIGAPDEEYITVNLRLVPATSSSTSTATSATFTASISGNSTSSSPSMMTSAPSMR